jgi:hypothetical protein
MTSYKAYLIYSGGQIALTEAVSFTFVKERYTPYTYFSGVFSGSCEPNKITSVKFFCGGKLIHEGIADSVVSEVKNGAKLVRVKSYGFSMLLGQNQSEPGIISSPDLSELIKRNTSIYKVGCESNTKTVNYVYINEKTTIWDAICIYAMKAYGTFPYISGTNTVRCTRSGSNSFSYSSAKILSTGCGVKLTNLISHGFTDDLDGNWTYSKVNSYATDRNITKYKYYSRDKEWVYNLNDEIAYKMNNADKGREYYEFCYSGYKSEDLLDRATVNSGNLNLSGAEIDRIQINGTSKGVFTTVSCYSDSYCPSSV